MKKTLNLLVIAFVLSFTLPHHTFGQNNFEKGYIIKSNGDTINLEIKKTMDSLQYAIVTTKTDDQITEFKPGELIGYGFLDGTFFSSEIKNDVFVQVLVEGYLSLYQNHQQFILIKDGNTTVLESQFELVELNGKLYQREKTKWKGTLAFLLSDCEEITEDQIKEMDFSERNLTKITMQYNACRGYDAIERKAMVPWSKMRYGVNFNYNSTTLNGSGYASDIRYLEESYSDTGIGAGLVFNLSFPRSGDRWALQLELIYLEAVFSSFIETEGSNRFITEFHDTNIEIGTLMIPIQVQHRIPINKHGIILEAGLLFDQNISAEATVSSQIQVGETTDIIPEREAFPIASGQIGLTAGAGYRHNFSRFSTTLNIRMNNLPRLVSSSDFEIDKSRISFNLIVMSR